MMCVRSAVSGSRQSQQRTLFTLLTGCTCVRIISYAVAAFDWVVERLIHHGWSPSIHHRELYKQKEHRPETGRVEYCPSHSPTRYTTCVRVLYIYRKREIRWWWKWCLVCSIRLYFDRGPPFLSPCIVLISFSSALLVDNNKISSKAFSSSSFTKRPTAAAKAKDELILMN